MPRPSGTPSAPSVASAPGLDSIVARSTPEEEDDCSIHILSALEAHRRQIRTLQREVASLRAASGTSQEPTSLLQPEHTIRSLGSSSLDDLSGVEAKPLQAIDLTYVPDVEAAPQKGSNPSELEEGEEEEFGSSSSAVPRNASKGSPSLRPPDKNENGNASSASQYSVSVLSSSPSVPDEKEHRKHSSAKRLNNNIKSRTLEDMKHTATGKHAQTHIDRRAPKVKKHVRIMHHSVDFHSDSRWMQFWECAVGFLILVNAVYLGWLTEAIATHNSPSEKLIDFIALFFTVAFSIDIVLRIFLLGVEFFIGEDRQINLFDFAIVVSMYPELLGIDEMPSSSAFRIVRILRLMRIIRTLRVFSFFREFRLMVWSTAEAIRSLVCIMSLGVIILYMAGLVMTDSCLSYCQDRSDDKTACKYFGTLGSSMLTLYEAILGGLLWGELMEALSPVDLFSQSMLFSYVSLCVLIILNVSAAFIFDVVQKINHIDREHVIHDELQTRKECLTTMRELFHEIDANSSGAISTDELHIACGDSRMEALLSVLKLETHDMHRLFHLIDIDNTNTVDIEEFMLGCQRLRGEARTIDIVSLQHEVDHILQHVLDIKDHVLPDQAFARNKIQETAVAEDGDEEIFGLYVNELRRSGSGYSESAGRIIKRVEERAMLLGELKQVCQLIKTECLSGSWTTAAGDRLNPENVNLYDFAYHCICPRTVPDGITICGLQRAKYLAGEIVTQVGTRYRAEGVVMEDSEDGHVRVRVSRGRFESSETGRHREISVENVKRGVPNKLVTSGAISYKELIARAPQKPTWYCSHWWGECIFEFVLCCEEHARRRKMLPKDSSYWICGYANRQYDLIEDIAKDITATAFWKAIGLSRGVLLVLDEAATPFKRIWCDFEIYQTLVGDSPKMLDIVTVTRQSDNQSLVCHMLSDGPLPSENAREKTKRESKFPLNILAAGLQVELEKGNSSVEDDRTRILKYVTKDSQDMGALQRANRTLNAFFARSAWPQAVKKNLVRDFDASQPGQLNLPQLTAQDIELKTYIMSLEHMEEVTDLELGAIAEGLPSSLLELQLSFEGCANITSVGIHTLGQSLPSKLQVLKLDFLGCRKIRDEGLELLARALPKSLKSIDLHFDRCDRIGIPGIKALAENVPRGAVFKGTFKGTAVDCNFVSLAELKRRANKEN